MKIKENLINNLKKKITFLKKHNFIQILFDYFNLNKKN